MSESFLKTHHISPANFLTILTEAAAGWRCSVRKGTLRNSLGKHLCQSLFLNKVAALRPATLLKKKTLTQVFSCEFCEISKNTFFTVQLQETASLLIGKICLLFNSVQKRLVGYHVLREYTCLKNVYHQIDSKNKWLLLPASFTAKCGLVFVLTQENAFRVCLKSKTLRNWLSPSSFLHHFSGITRNSEQKNILEINGQPIQFSYLLL